MQSKNTCSSRGRRRNSDKIFELQLSLVRSILINQKTLPACQGYCLAFQYVLEEDSLLQEWPLPVLGEIALERKLKCRREVAHGMWRMRLLGAGCLEVNGERSFLWLQCMPGFRQNGVNSDQTSSYFPCSFFPVPFELGKECCSQRALPSPAAEFSCLLSLHRVDWWSWDVDREGEAKRGIWKNKQLELNTAQAMGLN